MFDYFAIPFVLLFLGIAYRLRGGGWVTLGSDTYCRLIWGASLMIAAYAFLPVWRIEIDPSFFLLTPLFFLGFSSMALVPHAFAQNMGRNSQTSSIQPLSKRWPAALLPQKTQTEWNGMDLADRMDFDFNAMLCVGAVRGFIVFGLLGFIHVLFVSHFALVSFKTVAAIIAISVLQAVSYLLGWYVPFTVTNSLRFYSVEWCEFLNGIAWGIALVVYLAA